MKMKLEMLNEKCDLIPSLKLKLLEMGLKKKKKSDLY